MFKFDSSKFIKAFSERLNSIGYLPIYCKTFENRKKNKSHFEFTVQDCGQVSVIVDHLTSKILVKTSIKDDFFEKFRKITYVNNDDFIIDDRTNDIIYFKNMLGFLGLKQSETLFHRHLTHVIKDIGKDSLIPDYKDCLARISLSSDTFEINGKVIYNIDIIASIEYFYVNEIIDSKAIIKFSFKDDFTNEVYSLSFDDKESNIKEQSIKLMKTVFKNHLLTKLKSDFDISPELFESLSVKEFDKYFSIMEMNFI